MPFGMKESKILEVEQFVTPLIDGRIRVVLEGGINATWIFDTNNKQARKALVNLGWTPPGKTVGEKYKL